MTIDQNAARNRIRRLARISEIILLIAMTLFSIALIAVILVALFAPEERMAIVTDLLEIEANVAVVDAAWALGAVAFGLPALVIAIFALDTARRLMRGYRRGEIFTVEAGRRLRQIGWAVFAMPLVGSTMMALGGALFQLAYAENRVEVSISFDDGDILALAFGLLLVVVGQVLSEAQRLSEENESFV